MLTSISGAGCGGTLLPMGGGGSKPPPYAHGVAPYFKLYGTGQFDGQASGHEFMGNVYFPSTGEPMLLNICAQAFSASLKRLQRSLNLSANKYYYYYY